MFDADRSGAIGLDELESAITNLGMDPKQIDVEMLMKEADKRGNHQIDFDEVPWGQNESSNDFTTVI
jgi:Ca2+-binding EF-hand superfamily protein